MIYTPAEIRSIRGAAYAAGDGYMLMVIDLALKLGRREQDFVHAEWPDVETHHATFRVQGKVRKSWAFAPKDSEQRIIPIPADLLQSLSAWQDRDQGRPSLSATMETDLRAISCGS